MNFSVEGKRVLITAGSDGIGKAIASAFHGAGARVHICSRTLEKLEKCAAELPGLTYTVADAARWEDVEAVFRDVERKLGGLDFLINNAGIAGPTARVDEVGVEDWAKTIRTNIDSQFFCTKLAAPMMIAAGGGSIVNLGSTASLFAYPFRTPYAASKWAVIGFTKSVALELGEFGIRANAICPGCVEGPRIEGVIEREAAKLGQTPAEVRDGYLRQTALHTFIDAEDIAGMCLYLCSPMGAKISGQVMVIDGFTENCHS
ncbi:SDR family oxidoreductase [Cloacibacillus sp. An23]|uniref:SDR family oxidoreductase n=1 Tax=Cloacibacillus sp. An23 TaxID=1965591 RepID=UPI000B39C6E6|nr:SDR family oxidoreductase [Cloacibacillus sp. An23]OUO94411.1 3-oxoacyl-[acyl-carrier-protein] reductase [Cloacibacillus sp. An23]